MLASPFLNEHYTWLADDHDGSGCPVAQMALPRRVPAGFHGIWLLA